MRLPRPDLAAATPYSFPKPAIDKTLENGLRLLAFDLPGQYIISCQLVLPVPLAAEKIDGISTLLLNVASSGTKQHPGIAFSEAIEDQGASFSGRATHNATFARLDVAAGRLQAALPLLVEVVDSPELATEEIDRQKVLHVAQIEQINSNPSYIASKAFNKAVFSANMRLSRAKLGGIKQIENITRSDLEEIHGLWSPEAATLVLAGKLPENVESIVADAFSPWDGKASQKVDAEPIVERSQEPVVWVVDRPDAVQANVQIGGVGIGRRDERWAALRVACLAVGGSFGSRLNMLLREELGYTYGARLSPSPVGEKGTFNFSSSFRTDVAADAIKRTMEALRLDKPLSANEITDAKNYLLGISPMVYGTSAAIASQAAALVAVGLETNYLAQLDEQVTNITPEAANLAFHEVVLPSRCNVVAVGESEKLLSDLTDVGFDARLVEV